MCTGIVPDLKSSRKIIKSLVQVTKDAMRLYPTEEWTKAEKWNGFMGNAESIKESSRKPIKDGVKSHFCGSREWRFRSRMWETV